MRDLLEAGVHFGHQVRKWNPKMKKFIYTQRNGIYIIDLQKTVKAMDKALEALRQVASTGQPILFVGTKRQAKEVIKAESERCGQYFVCERWLGGMLTNFSTIRRNIKHLKSIEKMAEDGTFNVLPKKEVLNLEREREKLEKILGGIKNMPTLPGALFIIDTKREHIAVSEARKLNIPIIGMVDTNADPDEITYPIPSNDDAIRAITLITQTVANCIADGRKTLKEDMMAIEKGDADLDEGDEDQGDQKGGKRKPRSRRRRKVEEAIEAVAIHVEPSSSASGADSGSEE